ncbi:glutamate-1-semialdehyde 2,1-aminomutase [Seinonella peptonophila]|uniref:Glutamate-1-semialdehyde 2,1-aminomutase n=1 Tax=Seinonella peptonophila TaxID=112248 RepID=A0A1M4TUB9_9BACL|nr:glutamate-1-semialdehyde 2,1-aminomutase [Seinonella peptonophila]SHE48079.1 glutamate-1-semialdehyde 2,1-aminomutase [Seinonella peptonophila]
MALTFDKSIAFHKEAVEMIPGGVNSPVRAFRSVDMNPIYVKEAQGAKVVDVDGNPYIDYIGSWGPLIIGHAHPQVVKRIEQALHRGTSFGLPTELEIEMAREVTKRMPSVDVVRMVNSGTEATMSALRLARAYTGRSRILKFVGSYHGHSDGLLIRAGSGVATLGLPDSPGVPKEVAQYTMTVPYNNAESFTKVMEQYGNDVAAVIVEPIAGNMGVVPPLPGFLQTLREITEKYGTVLIFDEVMTGYRVDYYSAQGLYQVTPDLTTMGKVIGGGLPVGAYGGRREIMELVAPQGSVYQAGTLSGNPLAMAAGLATLEQLTEEAYQKLERAAAKLAEGIIQSGQETKIPVQINRVGSMVGLFFSDQPVTNYQQALQSNNDLFLKYYQQMVNEGILLAPSQYEGMFVSTAHTDEMIEQTVAIIRRVFKKLATES